MRRCAYDLTDEAATVLAGVRVREATDVRTSTGIEHKKKALLVDCEGVHASEGGVNTFTTETGRGDRQASATISKEGEQQSQGPLLSGRCVVNRRDEYSEVCLARRLATLHVAAAGGGHDCISCGELLHEEA